jgi:hypothetical protein
MGFGQGDNDSASRNGLYEHSNHTTLEYLLFKNLYIISDDADGPPFLGPLFCIL